MQLLPRAERESPKNRPHFSPLLHSWDLNPVGKSTALLVTVAEVTVRVPWRNLLEICPQELARILLSRAPGKVVEEVYHLKQRYKSARGWWWPLYCWPLCISGDWLWRSHIHCRNLVLEVDYTIGTRHCKCAVGVCQVSASERGSKTLCSCSVSPAPSTEQSLTLCGRQGTIFKGPRSILTEQAKSKNLKLRGNNLWLAHKGWRIYDWKSVLELSKSDCLYLMKSMVLIIQTMIPMHQCLLVVVIWNCISNLCTS